MGVPKNGWFIRENPHLPSKMEDDWWYAHFRTPPFRSISQYSRCLACLDSLSNATRTEREPVEKRKTSGGPAYCYDIRVYSSTLSDTTYDTTIIRVLVDFHEAASRCPRLKQFHEARHNLNLYIFGSATSDGIRFPLG